MGFWGVSFLGKGGWRLGGVEIAKAVTWVFEYAWINSNSICCLSVCSEYAWCGRGAVVGAWNTEI